jgi:hypothetical protein
MVGVKASRKGVLAAMQSDNGSKFEVPRISSVDVVGMVYEKFRPLTKTCGPLHAGGFPLEGENGTLYLTEMTYWLWSGKGTSKGKELTHPEVDKLTTQSELLRHLLASAAIKLKTAEAHLDRIQETAADVPSMLGYYLSKDAEAMTDIFATGSFFTLESPEY